MAANDPARTRLRPIIHAYLVDLARTGAYGKNKAAVMRHFIESGIVRALEAHVIDRRQGREFGDNPEDDTDDPDA